MLCTHRHHHTLLAYQREDSGVSPAWDFITRIFADMRWVPGSTTKPSMHAGPRMGTSGDVQFRWHVMVLSGVDVRVSSRSVGGTRNKFLFS